MKWSAVLNESCTYTHIERFPFLGQEFFDIRGHLLHDLPRLVPHHTKPPSLFIVDL